MKAVAAVAEASMLLAFLFPLATMDLKFALATVMTLFVVALAAAMIPVKMPSVSASIEDASPLTEQR